MSKFKCSQLFSYEYKILINNLIFYSQFVVRGYSQLDNSDYFTKSCLTGMAKVSDSREGV